MPIEPTQLLILGVIVLIANSIEAMTGFGATIIAVTLGAHVLPIAELVPILVPINLVLSGWIVFRHHGHIDQRELLGRILPCALIGLPVGYAIFTIAPGRILEIAFGAFVVTFAVRELLRAARGAGRGQPLPLPLGFAWLVAGGVAQGLYASGGPMIVYYAARAIDDKSTFRSTLSSLWLVLNIVLVVTHWLGGQSSLATLELSAWLVLPLLGGIAIGEFLHHRISEEKFRHVVMLLLLLAGVALLLK